ncbi:hypothetical protein [Streptomyces dysideae]|jgi:hypothetical protein|uniref:hypothetical protein n=1 Tax=Streptomyces dysideae TaxID=909626 RepID=UPI000ABBBB79|nr:hypothetical protein [Streptomyces dysideae]
MSATERDESPPRVGFGVSMRDLLAAGVAANVISTPPREPDPQPTEPHTEERRAA